MKLPGDMDAIRIPSAGILRKLASQFLTKHPPEINYLLIMFSG